MNLTPKMNGLVAFPTEMILLQLLSPNVDLDDHVVTRLTSKQLGALILMVRSHRLGPLVRYMLKHYHSHVDVPGDLQQLLDRTYKTASFRSLQLQKGLLDIHQALVNAGIPYIALKGAYLAFHAYPQPALRPMRDLDILVPEDQSIRAFNHLLSVGFTRKVGYDGNIETAADHNHHLPPVVSPDGNIIVEIHNQLAHDVHDQTHLTTGHDFWSRAISLRIGQESIRFESATDMLRHLIHHSVYHHHFDNGPLLLTDVAFLLQQNEVNWELFWNLVEADNMTKGSVLVLRLVKVYWPTSQIFWPDFPYQQPSQEILDAAAMSLLRDYDRRGEVMLKSEFSSASWLGKLKIALKRAFPPKQYLAMIYPVSPDSRKIYVYYLVNLWRIAIQRVPTILKSTTIDHSEEINRLKRLDAWLAH